MNCHEVREQLPLLLSGDVTSEERSSIELHIRECPACRREQIALDAISHELSANPPAILPVDLSAIYRTELAANRTRTRRWRIAAMLAVAASIALLLSRLNWQVHERQLTVSWGREVPAPAANSSPPIAHIQDSPPDSNYDDRLRTMSELIQALAANIESMDRGQREQFDRFKSEFAEMRQQSNRRMTATERDLAALYTAQFGSRSTGANP